MLLIDTAATALTVGLQAQPGAVFRWRHATDEAGVALLRETGRLSGDAGLAPADLHTVLFCIGPGSILGIRIAAMVLRTWAVLPRAAPLTVLGYHSLALAAADLLAGGTTGPFQVISDARRETWNILAVAADGSWSGLRRAAAGELPREAGPVFTPEGFPHWQPLPAAAQPVPYRPARLPELAPAFPLLQAVAAPDAFMIEPPTYRTWNPAPAAS